MNCYSILNVTEILSVLYFFRVVAGVHQATCVWVSVFIFGCFWRGVGFGGTQSEVSCRFSVPGGREHRDVPRNLGFRIDAATRVAPQSYRSPLSYNIYRTVAILAFLFHFSIELKAPKVIPYDEGVGIVTPCLKLSYAWCSGAVPLERDVMTYDISNGNFKTVRDNDRSTANANGFYCGALSNK